MKLPLASIAAAAAAALLAKELVESNRGDAGAFDVLSLAGFVLLIALAIGLALGRRRVTRTSGKPVLAVDLDEVCCGYLPAFIKFSNAKHGTSLTLDDFHSCAVRMGAGRPNHLHAQQLT